MSEPCADGMCWSGPLCAIIDDLKAENARLAAAATEACEAEFTSERLAAMTRLRIVLGIA